MSTCRPQRASAELGGPSSAPSTAWPMSHTPVSQSGLGPGPVLHRPQPAERLDEHGPHHDTVHHATVHGCLDQTPDAVAAHLGHTSVGVAQFHRQGGGPGTGHGPQHAVGPDAPVAIAQGAHLGRRQGPAVVGVEQDEEVVARAVVLGQAQRAPGVHRVVSLPPRCGAGAVPAPPRSCASEIAAGVEPGDAGVAPEPRPLPAGEGPGPPLGLGHGTVREGTPSSTWARSSRYPSAWRAVRDSPPGRAGQGAYLLDEARLEQIVEAIFDAGVVDAGSKRMPTSVKGVGG